MIQAQSGSHVGSSAYLLSDFSELSHTRRTVPLTSKYLYHYEAERTLPVRSADLNSSSESLKLKSQFRLDFYGRIEIRNLLFRLELPSGTSPTLLRHLNLLLASTVVALQLTAV